MAFYDHFREIVTKINQKAKYDFEVRKVLREYTGRTFTVRVYDDTTYVISIFSYGITLKVSHFIQDMVLDTDIETMKWLLSHSQRKIGLLEKMSFGLKFGSFLKSGTIKLTNIGDKEIGLLRKLMGF